jgi:hypothetical protein
MRAVALIEIVSLVPVTVALAPLLTVGTAMFIYAAALTVIGSGSGWREILGFATLILWLLAGLAGLVTVWIVTIQRRGVETFSRRQRAVRIAGLLMGASAAGLFFYSSAAMTAQWNGRQTIFWVLVFVPPTVLGLRHGLPLCRASTPLPDHTY